MTEEKAGFSDLLAGKAEINVKGLIFILLLLALLLSPFWPIIMDLIA